ncbi:polysaccharide deacetylase family protein [Rhizobium sp. TH2]|uniref:polysaccharide deacetylase family protein n=1 Tax=Rhizobium sp. TH2 TaxID=2775403 RepID=UPI002157F854|nr:polysaccharide deacetylase family protein [Rhizobium sp. TH2]UVC06988.1 polysaccharide deacetylase family protein [Rhizobium sp. TH2]
MTNDPWAELRAELDRWQQAGRTARFWLRDDDAMEPTPELERLLVLAEKHGAPLTLAVIPQHTGEVLARRLDACRCINVAAHGWSHRNFAGEGEKKQELGPHRAASDVLAELKAAFEKLSELYPGAFAPVLVPPWNRIAAHLIPELEGIGFRALSVFGPEKRAPIRLINTHADIMDWHGTRGGRADETILADIVKRLGEMSVSGGTMGLLTHHLVHDEAAWSFIDRLLAFTLQHAACRWVSLPELLADS